MRLDGPITTGKIAANGFSPISNMLIEHSGSSSSSMDSDTQSIRSYSSCNRSSPPKPDMNSHHPMPEP